MNNFNKSIADLESTLINLEHMLKDGTIRNGEAQVGWIKHRHGSTILEWMHKQQESIIDIENFTTDHSHRSFVEKRKRLNIVDVQSSDSEIDKCKIYLTNVIKNMSTKPIIQNPVPEMNNHERSSGYLNIGYMMLKGELLFIITISYPNLPDGILNIDVSEVTHDNNLIKDLRTYVIKYLKQSISDADIIGLTAPVVYNHLDQIMIKLKEIVLQV